MVDSEVRIEERQRDQEGLPSPVSSRIRDGPVPTRYVLVPLPVQYLLEGCLLISDPAE